MPPTNDRQQTRLPLANQGKTKPQYKPFVPGPNPDLLGFIKAHAAPYDPAKDAYNVKAFDRDIAVNKAAPPRAILNMHRYWSKKHWAAIREYIRHYLPKKYYQDGTGLVLDCFSGSGMTGVAAMMENHACVLTDVSPAAAFISYCYTHPFDPDELQTAYDRMLTEPYTDDLKQKLKVVTGTEIRNLQEELDWLYNTKCDRCGGDATTEYVVYSQRFQCPRCGEVVALIDCPEVKVPYETGSKAKQKTELKKRRVCPHCLKKYVDPHRDFVISTRTKTFGPVPVLVSYACQNGCKPPQETRTHNDAGNTKKGRYFLDHDLAKLKKLEKAEIPHLYPKRKMMDIEDDKKPWGDNWRPGRNFRSIAELYTKRNLWALSALKARAANPFLQLALSATTIGLSRMQGYSPGSSFPNMIISGTYYVPQMTKQYAVGPWFAGKVKSVLAATRALSETLSGDIAVSAESATNPLPAECIDYIFTDPAYVDKVQYGELNFVWEAWLGFSGSWLDQEIIVNAFRNKSLDDWEAAIRTALANCFRSLKPGRWLSLCYHDTEPGTWTRIQNILLDTGFEIHNVTVLDPKQKSSNQLLAEKVVKSDLVLNCRKPHLPTQQGSANTPDLSQVSHRVSDILIDTLSTTGGQTRDKLWDIVLKRLLTRGQMAEHRFEDILSEVATRSEAGRWFLKEEFEALSENDLRNEEEAGHAIERFARFRCMGVPATLAADFALTSDLEDTAQEDTVEKHIKRHVLAGAEAQAFKLGGRLKGCEFYDCLFFYLTRYLKGRAAGRTPRRNLAEFLEEYLVRFRDGDKWLYRPPTDVEAISLKQSRQSGLGRRIRQFVAFLKDEGDFPKDRMPDAKTLVAWLKHCANFGLAEAGVALYPSLIGQLNQLSEDDRYDAEDYYSQCRRSAKKEESEDAAEPAEEETES
jgi:DNA modification methylase